MKKIVSLFIALALVMSVMLTGCSGSVTIPDTNIELGFSMSQKDIEKILGSLQGSSSSDDNITIDDETEKDDDETTTGHVGIYNTVVDRKNGKIQQVTFDVRMTNIDKDDYKNAAAQAAAIVIRRLDIDIDDVKAVKMYSTSDSKTVQVVILVK